jgi:PAS domain S-box-containing protein
MGAATVPVLVKNGSGYYLFANRAAEALLGYDPGQIGGKHFLELVYNDPDWVAVEWERFKAQRVWNGSLIMRHKGGDRLRVGLNAFASTLRGHTATYTALVHPLGGDIQHAAASHGRPRRYDLTANEIRIVQLLAEGFSDRDLSAITGISEWAIAREIALVLQKMGVRSRTEACVRAMRSGLIF